MTSYVLRRLVEALVTLFLISLLTFIVAKLTPGGPFGLEDTDQSARIPQEMRDHYRRLYGLDLPIALQYAHWLASLAQGDLGMSYTYRNESVRHVLGRSWQPTFQVGITATCLSLGLGVPLGLLAAIRRGRSVDHLSRALTVLGAATPVYVLATLSVIVFAVNLKVLPLTGWGQPVRIALPGCVLAMAPLSAVIRLTRASALEVLHSDYLRTARAKGLTERQVLVRHLLKNVLLPVLTFTGPMVASLLAGSFFVETIFNVPGLGATFVYAAGDRDYPLVMAAAVVSGSLIVLLNLAVDLAYSFVDPRILTAGQG